MKCPVDFVDLVMSERSGVEIDYCPKCRGVWLDRGELDKIIDRVNGGSGATPPRPSAASPQPPIAPPPIYNPFESRPRYDDRERRDYDRRDYDGRDRSDRDQYGRKRKKKEGFLGDLFDF